ncbi:MAG: CAP domain-containing protein, partial [Actinomycetota bacterium]
MVKDGVLRHSPDHQLSKRVTNWRVLGENVGMGGSPRSLHAAFMDSQAHRRNILEPDFVRVGIGTKKDSDGALWVTVILESRANPGTTLSMPSC